MKDLILILLIAAIVIAAAVYLYKAKKRGVKCVGCPDGGCSGCSGSCGCGAHRD